MKLLSWMLLSVWTSSSSILIRQRYTFVSGFATSCLPTRYQRYSTLSHYFSPSSMYNNKRNHPIAMMEQHIQSKRARTEGANIETAKLSRLSPYERRMGEKISICSKCMGEGKIRAPLSKKARARHIQMQQSSIESGDHVSKTDMQPQMKPCRVCDGSGLITSPLPSESTTETDQTMVGNHEMKNTDGQSIQHPLSVAIVGGGIGGIALAAALQHRHIPCVVYERDTSFEERKQGYGLTMQQGARALRSLGFFSFSDDNDKNGDNSGSNVKFGIHSTRHKVHKPDGTVVGEWGMKVWGGRHEKGRKHAKRQNAHISRQNLRKVLIEMLQPGTIQWGYKFMGYNDGEKTSHLNLTFQRRGPECGEEDTFTTSATVLVGCDGIRSAVRASKLGEDVAPLRYLGCIVILGIVASPNSELTDGETVFQTADGVTRLYAMPFAEAGDHGNDCEVGDRGLSMWQLSFPMEESEATELSRLGPSALKAEALKRCGQWHDPIPSLLSETKEHLITGYPCYDRALVDKQVFREGCNDTPASACSSFVTMLGDAAHPMSPFKGQVCTYSMSLFEI